MVLYQRSPVAWQKLGKHSVFSSRSPHRNAPALSLPWGRVVRTNQLFQSHLRLTYFVTGYSALEYRIGY